MVPMEMLLKLLGTNFFGPSNGIKLFIYVMMCSNMNNISRYLKQPLEIAPAYWLLPGNGNSPELVHYGWQRIEWILGSLSNLGAYFQFCPNQQRAPLDFFICQPKKIIASRLSQWLTMRLNKNIHCEGRNGWKCLNSIKSLIETGILFLTWY